MDYKYPNVPGFIAPYLGAQYGVLEHENGFQPRDAKELFNHRHSLLRGITDRTFGALKERFPIIMSAPSYPLPTQVKLVVAACALHNYIRDEKPDDNIFKMYENEGCVSQLDESMIQPLDVQKPEMKMMNVDSQMLELDVPFDAQQIENSSQLRDSIAAEIWNDYIHDFPITEG